MPQLGYAFVNRISRADSENEDRCDERPEEALFPVPKWMPDVYRTAALEAETPDS
jgi:hypothetical protein